MDKTIRMWDINTGECLGTMLGHSQDVGQIIVTDNDQCCISGSGDTSLRLWDLQNFECHQVLEGHSKGITVVESFLDNRYIATGSNDSCLVIWELDWDWSSKEDAN